MAVSLFCKTTDNIGPTIFLCLVELGLMHYHNSLKRSQYLQERSCY